MARTIEMEPVYTERVTPRRYLKVYNEDPEEIDSVRIVPPRIGTLRDFGSFQIKRKTPTFQMVNPKMSRGRSFNILFPKSGRFEITKLGKVSQKRKSQSKRKKVSP